jgi:diguanylate cyclase (GGDEF)-like protein/PAS domain S-box-containing protein
VFNYWLPSLLIFIAIFIAVLILLILHRITLQRRQVEKNRQISSEEIFHSYVDSIPDGVAVVDQDGVIVSASCVLLSMFGYDCAEQMTGRKISDFIAPVDREIFVQKFHEGGSGDNSGFNQYQAIRSDGQTFFEETTFNWLDLDGNGLREAVVIFHDVTEHKRIEESEIRARKTAEALQAVGLVINSTLDYSQMLNLVLEQIGRVLTFDLASILMKDGDEIYITALRGFENPNDFLHKRYSLVGESPNVLVLEQRRPVIVNAVEDKFPSFKESSGYITQSWMGIPLFSRDEIIGFLNLDSKQAEHFSENDKLIAEAFAVQVAIALENARLYTESQRRLKEQAVQNEISRSLSLKLDEKEFFDVLYEQVCQFIEIGTFIITSYEPGSEVWETVYYRQKDLRMEPFSSSLEEGFSGYVLQTGAPIFLRNSEMVTEFACQTGRASILSEPKSIMIIPLVVSDRVLGAIGAQNDDTENAYSQEDFNLFTSIGSQIAVAFENTRLFNRMEQLAIVDNLTGIFNRRHFFDLAHREYERADRYNRPFAAIMMDIDHFKRVNDTLGHSAGDQTLQAIAALCQRTIRHVDVVGRYGGEEFAFILPETNLEQARAAAERLRKIIEEFEVVTTNGHIRLTVSIGISARQSGGETLEALIERADQGLYAAKEAGRNMVRAVN